MVVVVSFAVVLALALALRCVWLRCRKRVRLTGAAADMVTCVGEGEPWTIAKRFSEFAELRETLTAGNVAAAADLSFPSKGLWQSATVVDERRKTLQT